MAHTLGRSYQMIALHNIRALSKHLNNKLRISKRPDRHKMSLIRDAHCAQAEAFHIGARGKKKAMIDIVEKMLRIVDWSRSFGVLIE